jgi:hypothetical protein
VRYTLAMTQDATTPDPLALTPENLWVAVYRDRMRGGTGYEFIITSHGEAGRALAHLDPSTIIALSLSELSTLLKTLMEAPALRAPGALNWLPIGMCKHVVWGRKQGVPSAQLVLARSADGAAAVVMEQGQKVAAVTDLSQVQGITSEMKEVLQNNRYEKILTDLRPEAKGFAGSWLQLKQDPVRARYAKLIDALEDAGRRGERDPVAAQEILDIMSEGGTRALPPLEDLLAYIRQHLT